MRKKREMSQKYRCDRRDKGNKDNPFIGLLLSQHEIIKWKSVMNQRHNKRKLLQISKSKWA